MISGAQVRAPQRKLDLSPRSRAMEETGQRDGVYVLVPPFLPLLPAPATGRLRQRATDAGTDREMGKDRVFRKTGGTGPRESGQEKPGRRREAQEHSLSVKGSLGESLVPGKGDAKSWNLESLVLPSSLLGPMSLLRREYPVL